MVPYIAIWYETMKIFAKISDEGDSFLGVSPKAIWLIYFEKI